MRERFETMFPADGEEGASLSEETVSERGWRHDHFASTEALAIWFKGHEQDVGVLSMWIISNQANTREKIIVALR